MPESSESTTDARALPRYLSPRAVWTLLGAVFVLGAAVIAIVIFSGGSRHPGVEFVGFSRDSTATVGFAGVFPPEKEPPLARPLGITGDGKRLYIALADAGTIAVFDYDGTAEETLPVPPAENMPTATPIAVALMPDGRLLVADTTGSRVVAMAAGKGGDVTRFGPASGQGAIRKPTALATLGKRVFVADSADSSVSEYDESGAFVKSMTFDAPAPRFVGGLVAHDGKLYVSDSNAGRVVIVDLESGKQRGVFERQLGLPRGLAVDGKGDVFVSETFGRRLTLFDPSGSTVIDTIADARTERIDEGGMPSSPESVFWDEKDSRLYVTDAVAGRVLVYNLRDKVE